MHETTQITYGEGTITITMSSESLTEVSAPDVRFGDYNSAVKAFFTTKELAEIESGTDARVEFTFVMRDELSDHSQQKIFDKAIARAAKTSGTLHEGVYFDVEADKSIGGDQTVELDKLYESVEVQFGIPLYLVAEDRYYYIMTNEAGSCELEPDIDEDADTLSVSTQGIGTTVMLYQSETESLSRKDRVLHIQSHHLIIGGIILLALAWVFIDRNYRKG